MISSSSGLLIGNGEIQRCFGYLVLGQDSVSLALLYPTLAIYACTHNEYIISTLLFQSSEFELYDLSNGI